LSEVCECCGRPLDFDPVEQIRAWLLDRGHVVNVFDQTNTAGAAAVLDMEPQSLRSKEGLIYRRLR
jgi:hypothetical protein